MILYLSGPMTGFPDHNKAAFDEAALALRAVGFIIISPVELDEDRPEWFQASTGWEVSDEEYNDLLDRDVDQVALADGIIFLPGWSNSGGAGREGEHARDLRKRMYLWIPDMPQTPLELPLWLFNQYHRTERLRPGEVVT